LELETGSSGEMLAVRAENLSKTYTGEAAPVRVLANLSFELPAGEFAAVMGPSGVGKSTLLHLLGGIDRPDSGRVEIFGRSLEEMSPRERARFRNETIGFVFQFHHLLPEFNALENVMMPALIARVPAPEAKRRSEALLEELGLAARASHRPGALSGGEQQRVAVARALVQSPRILLADEPTGNLDKETGDRLNVLLRRLNQEKGITVVMATHSADAAARASRVFRLLDGRLVP